jgi:hypothetical protein
VKIWQLPAVGGTRTIALKKRLLWVRHFEMVNELQQALPEFKESCTRRWLIAGPGHDIP